MLAEILGTDILEIPIRAHTDSNNLYQAVYSTKFVDDKKLRLDIAQIQEAVSEENVQVIWIKAEEMLADCLTEKGVNQWRSTDGSFRDRENKKESGMSILMFVYQ